MENADALPGVSRDDGPNPGADRKCRASESLLKCVAGLLPARGDAVARRRAIARYFEDGSMPGEEAREAAHREIVELRCAGQVSWPCRTRRRVAALRCGPRHVSKRSGWRFSRDRDAYLVERPGVRGMCHFGKSCAQS
jgi:hypothetical protein